MRTQSAVGLWAAVTLGGCSAQIGAEGGIGQSRQWLCASVEERVTCEAAIPAAPEEAGAYACWQGGDAASCPPDDAVDAVREQLEALGVWEALAGEPWACLLTGAHERHCSKDLAPRSRAGEPALDQDPDGAMGDPAASLAAPGLPADCGDAAWQEFFCGHATWSYQEHGVDIVFPCDIFDARADFMELAIDAGFAGQDGLPSCHDGEWEMREGAWLAAVQAGCLELDQEILVLCQQGANHAARDAKCNATGTW